MPAGIRPLDAINDGYDEITQINFIMMQAMPDSVVEASSTMGVSTRSFDFSRRLFSIPLTGLRHGLASLAVTLNDAMSSSTYSLSIVTWRQLSGSRSRFARTTRRASDRVSTFSSHGRARPSLRRFSGRTRRSVTSSFEASSAELPRRSCLSRTRPLLPTMGVRHSPIRKSAPLPPRQARR